ncbi:MAG TPA: hypothetical protein VFE23_15045 [Usitatibacter sp.]|jgi:hypothetical protein|nr:hypothetical protein [Usitatibacter sp.]
MRIGGFIALAGLAAFIAYCFRRNAQLRAEGLEARDDLKRWEAEGGNVPAVATPSPAAPATYVPGGDPNVRH